jgi:hypothetical protein
LGIYALFKVRKVAAHFSAIQDAKMPFAGYDARPCGSQRNFA